VAKSYTVSAKLEAKDNASPKIRGVRGAFEGLGSFLASGWGAAVGAATAAFGGLVGAFKAGISAASEAEDAQTRLLSALTPLGAGAKGVAEALNEQSAALQKTTRFSDETVTSAQALLANMGLAASQIPVATQAAADLAAALKIDLNSAAQQVGKTLNGIVSRDLRAVIPALGALDAAALKSGEGLKLISAQFSGRAVADAATFSGAIEKVKNAFDDLLEKLGESVTKNPEVQASFERLTAALTDPATVEGVAKFGTAVVGLVTSLGELAAKVPAAAQATADVGRGLTASLAEGLKDALGVTDEQAAAMSRLTDSTVNYEKVGQSPAIQAIGRWIESLRSAGAATREQAEATDAIGTAAESAAQKLDLLAAANERAVRIQNEQAGAQADFLEALKSAGITLSDNEAAQKRQEEVIRLADLAYRDGRITVQQYDQVVGDAKQKVLDLTAAIAAQPAKLSATSSALRQTTREYNALTAAANAAFVSQRRFGGATASERNRATITFAGARSDVVN